MRVGILGIQHESNTFFPELTELKNFQESILLRGEEVRCHYEYGHHEVTGFFSGLSAANVEAVPLMMAFAMPAGAVTDAALDALWEMALEELRRAGALDGVLLAPHGAAVNVSRPDMDGWWLSKLRALVGTDIPLIAVIDPHANFSQTMAACCDGVIAYRENPHVDQKQRGLEAADLMVRRLRGEIFPVLAAAFPNVAMNIERQLTWAEPMLSVKVELDRVRKIDGVLSASIVMGYPYADVAEMGSSFIVVTDGKPSLAVDLACGLGNWLENKRERFRGILVSPEQAVIDGLASRGPVALLDMGDNLGGGAPADSTILAHLCHKLALQKNSFICLFDPASVVEIAKAGNGCIILSMGGKRPLSPAPPLECEVTILGLYDGHFRESEARHGGLSEFNMGRTAIVTTKFGLTIMLTSRPVLPASANQMISFGLNPFDFDLIILKGVHLPVAAYRELCPTMIRVNTPGVTTADMNNLRYKNRRNPLFPFENIESKPLLKVYE